MLTGKKELKLVPRQALACGALFVIAVPLDAYAAGGGGDPVMTLVWSIINFSLFFLIMLFIYKKNVARLVRARSARISEYLQRSKNALAEAEQEYGELKEKLNNIEGVKKDLFERYNEEGRKQSTLLIEGGNSSAVRIKSDAERQVETELSQESKKIRKEVVSTAVGKARKQLSGLSEDEDKKLRADALNNFLNQEAAGRLAAQ